MSTAIIPAETTFADLEHRHALLARVDELSGLLAANALIADEQRKVPDESIRALVDAGVFRVTRPHAYGGLEVSSRTLFEVLAAVGRHCPSSAWIGGLSNASAWAISHFPEQAVTEIFEENPDALFCGAITIAGEARRVTGGFEVNGSWGFQSGSYYADWAMLGTPVIDEHGEVVDQVFVLIPRSELGWKDTWHVAGMRGTGSNTLSAEKVFVPEHRSMSLPRTLQHEFPQGFPDSAHFNMPLVPLFTVALISPQIGMARGALDTVLASLGKGKGISHSFYKNASEVSFVQSQVAEAASLIDTAEALLRTATEEIDRWGASGEFMPIQERARAKMAVDRAAVCAREAVDTLLNVGGASSFGTFNRLQMYWRDIETASRHAFISPAIAREAYGRTLLGIAHMPTPFV
ncbi:MULTISPECIES: acyl-CoA dehydrogenase family protein [Micrococcaceae]|uniref:acyl-CoA dehydrogenase family protein n=1 Tax=Micrococcaceae TaxID=1268 RepID=UPI0004B37B03|nr:acyl-CoA dehydrogenase family protein [Arthrobacter sp. MA-N2]